MIETFKEIIHRGVKFEVGSNGTIRINGKVRKPVLNQDGYYRIWFCADNITPTVIGHHRLIAMAYVDNDDPVHKVEVNHKDYNRINNTPENLEWVTHRDNVLHLKEHYRKFGVDNPNYGNHKLSQKYKDNPELSLEKQSRKGLQNGRCRPIKLFYNGEYIKTFDYVELCINYLRENNVTTGTSASVRGRIDASVRNNKPYKGYTFEKM